MADTPKGETVVPAPLGNDVTPQSVPAPPAQDNTKDTGETDELRKELEKARMRESQLNNQLKAKEEAEAKAKDKELEEQNQFKELFEQEKAKREALETDQQAKERENELLKVKQEVLQEFSEEVRTLAEEVGLSLTDADETAVSSFKEKLEKISLKVNADAKPGPNNPHRPDKNIELSTDELRVALQDENSFHDLVTKKFPGIAAMTQKRQ